MSLLVNRFRRWRSSETERQRESVVVLSGTYTAHAHLWVEGFTIHKITADITVFPVQVFDAVVPQTQAPW